jgi:hypothetical protein
MLAKLFHSRREAAESDRECGRNGEVGQLRKETRLFDGRSWRLPGGLLGHPLRVTTHRAKTDLQKEI